jgi:hypothetical protein
MDRTELTAAIAAVLLGAVVLGWILHWLFQGINSHGRGRQAADLAHRLHEAEVAQARAERRLAEVEDDLGARLAEVQAELDATIANLALARAQTEAIRDAYRAAMAGRDTPPPA